MKTIFIPALAFRRYIQKKRSESQISKKLDSVARRARTSPISVLKSYERGEDILDPSIFPREDIIEFAKTNNIINDPMVIAAINAAMPSEYWKI